MTFGAASSVVTVTLVVFLLFGFCDASSLIFIVFALIAKATMLGSTYCAQIFTAEVYPTCIR